MNRYQLTKKLFIVYIDSSLLNKYTLRYPRRRLYEQHVLLVVILSLVLGRCSFKMLILSRFLDD